MTTNNAITATTATATAAARALWVVVESSHELSVAIATLCQAFREDFKAAGTAFGDAWREIGGDVCPSASTRILVEACHGTNMTKKAASKFLNAMELVTKQRICQLLAVVFDGDKSKNKGTTKGTEDTSKESLDGLDKPAGNGFTVAQILAALETLQSITFTEAEALASVIASKVI